MSEQQTQREQFLRAIAATRKMIAKWPAWKRNALGPVPAAPSFPPVAAPEPMDREYIAQIARDVKTAADAWDQSARLLGNVTAAEIGELCRWCLDAIAARPRLALGESPHE